jgi:hypothetical protein
MAFIEDGAAMTGLTFYLPPGVTPTDPLGSASGWARAGITEALAKGFVPTDIQNSYTNTITRAEFCRMAVKWLEVSLGVNIDAIVAEKGIADRAGHTFSDTTDPAILAAYRLGVTAGSVAPTSTTPGRFNPSGQFTRLEAAMMIMNACGVAGLDVANAPTANFADMDKAASWAHPGINFVHANGIMSGDGTNFLPMQTYSREQSILTFNNVQAPAPGASNPGQTPTTPGTSGGSLAQLEAGLGVTFSLWDDVAAWAATDDYFNLKDSGIKNGIYFTNGLNLPDNIRYGDGSAAAAAAQKAGFSQAAGLDTMTSGTYYIRVDAVNHAVHVSAVFYIFIMP